VIAVVPQAFRTCGRTCFSPSGRDVGAARCCVFFFPRAVRLLFGRGPPPPGKATPRSHFPFSDMVVLSLVDCYTIGLISLFASDRQGGTGYKVSRELAEQTVHLDPPSHHCLMVLSRGTISRGRRVFETCHDSDLRSHFFASSRKRSGGCNSVECGQEKEGEL